MSLQDDLRANRTVYGRLFGAGAAPALRAQALRPGAAQGESPAPASREAERTLWRPEEPAVRQTIAEESGAVPPEAFAARVEEALPVAKKEAVRRVYRLNPPAEKHVRGGDVEMPEAAAADAPAPLKAPERVRCPELRAEAARVPLPEDPAEAFTRRLETDARLYPQRMGEV